MAHLSEPIRNTIKSAFELRPHEEVLIITDEPKLNIAKGFAEELKNEGAKVNTHILLDELRPYKQISHSLKAAIIESDLTIYLLKDIMEEKPFRSEIVRLGRKKGRVCMMPSVTEDILKRTLHVDYDELSSFVKNLSSRITGSEEVKIEDEKGTNLSFSLHGRHFEHDVGKITRAGGYGNLPAGEIITSPVEKTFNGVVHFNQISDFEPQKGYFKFKEGEVVEHKGIDPELEELMKKKRNRTIGEFGIGANPKAKASSNFLEAEKALGTIHFALGDSYGLGKNKSDYRFVFLLEKPTMVVNGEKIMDRGKFKVYLK